MINLHKSQKNAGKPWTYTKVAVTILLIVGVAGGAMPYILSACDKDPAESMGIAWVTEIVAVILGYLCKSYFETKQEAKQATEDRKVSAYLQDDKFDPSKAAG